MADEPILSMGDTGEWVTYLQQMLEGQGFGTGFTADQFDETTQDAVNAAQQQYGLEATGVCDENTWAALDSATTVSSPAPDSQTDQDSTSQTDQDSTSASYDPEAWHSFLAENGPYWNGDDAAWDQFRTWFAYEAGQQSLADPAVGFLTYVEGQQDKVAAFAAYGVIIASATGSGDDANAAASQGYDASTFPETKVGDSGSWVAYLDAMLTSNGF